MENLNSLTCPELRQRARDKGITHIQRDGQKVTVSRARKAELVSALTPKVTRKPKEENLDRLIRRTAQGILEETRSSFNPATQSFGLPSVKLAGIASSAASRLGNWEGWDGRATVNTIAGHVSLFCTGIKETLDEVATEHGFDSATIYQASSNTDYVVAVVKEAFRETFRAKKRQTETANKEKLGSVARVRISPLVAWAVAVIEFPETVERWETLSCAIALVTGRRLSETHSSGVYTLVPGRSDVLRFEGQLKRKSGNKLADIYTIPVLTDASKIVRAIEILRSFKRVRGSANGCKGDPVCFYPSDHKKSKNLLTRPLSAEAKKVYHEHMEIVEPSTASKGIRGTEDLTYHGFREIYAHALLGLNQDAGTLAELGHRISEALGHSDSTTWQQYQNKMLALDSRDELLGAMKSLDTAIAA